ncbi:hypothetical protein L5515_012645 [Caenorhabditis briggsae]|uniref:Sdz-33 F-box domain-containing protein n=1 Tax=Caenorhabditis briggsae TaxID=6238 RepID=A0AAE9EZA7_CAEBR|nr:hypothetical protein L5515_012645 [Caenorhabditis briggsae]
MVFCNRHARVSRYCIIDDCVSDDFEFNGKLGPMRKLFIGSIGHWVTLNNLINFDVLFIRIQGSILSVSDLNSFLRHWRTGGSARLEWLYLNFEKGMFRETFDEDLEIVKTDEVRVYDRSSDALEWVFDGGYSIQRTDGVKAEIECGPGWFTMGVWH